MFQASQTGTKWFKLTVFRELVNSSDHDSAFLPALNICDASDITEWKMCTGNYLSIFPEWSHIRRRVDGVVLQTANLWIRVAFGLLHLPLGSNSGLRDTCASTNAHGAWTLPRYSGLWMEWHVECEYERSQIIDIYVSLRAFEWVWLDWVFSKWVTIDYYSLIDDWLCSLHFENRLQSSSCM